MTIIIRVEKVGINCGFGVPYYDYKDNRPNAVELLGQEDGMKAVEYRVKENTVSVGGLPGIKHERISDVECEYQGPPSLAKGKGKKAEGGSGGRGLVEWIVGLGRKPLTYGACFCCYFCW